MGVHHGSPVVKVLVNGFMGLIVLGVDLEGGASRLMKCLEAATTGGVDWGCVRLHGASAE